MLIGIQNLERKIYARIEHTHLMLVTAYTFIPINKWAMEKWQQKRHYENMLQLRIRCVRVCVCLCIELHNQVFCVEGICQFWTKWQRLNKKKKQEQKKPACKINKNKTKKKT